MFKTKLAYNLKTGKSIICDINHASSLPVKDFDKFVRAIYYPEKKLLYFRFWNPSGEYSSIMLNDFDYEESYKACDNALDGFLKAGIIPKKTKVLYWLTGKLLNDSDISY